MTEAFVGFDSAWGDKKPGAIAWAARSNGRVDTGLPKPANFCEAAGIIEKLQEEHDYLLVAIDQPTLVPNESGARPVERVAGSVIGKLRSGVQPANRGKERLFGLDAPIWRFLKRLGACMNPAAARKHEKGRFLIEVYPGLALPALAPDIMRRGDAARYNPANRKKFRLRDWKLVAHAVEVHAQRLDMEALSEWARERKTCSDPTKAQQDELDAAICLIIALQWRSSACDRLAVIGDEQFGYMATPVSDKTKEILEQAARRKGVPLDTTWPCGAKRS